MQSFLIGILVLLGIFLTVMMCRQESQQREISFIYALALCLLITPPLAFFVITSKPLRNTL